MTAKNEGGILSKVEGLLHSHLEMATILNNVLKTVAAGLHSEKASLMLLDEETGELRIETAYGLSEEIMKSVRLRAGDGSISGWVAQSGETILLSDGVQDPRFKGINPNIKAAVSVPLKIGDEVVGLINVSNVAKEKGFTADDVVLLESIASQCAALVKSLKLQRLLCVRTQKLELLHQISAMVNALLNSNELLKIVTRTTLELLDGGGAVSYLTRDGTVKTVAEVTLGTGGDHARDELFLRLAGESMRKAELVSLTRDGVHEYRAALERQGLNCVMCAPLHSQKDMLGSLLVYREAADKKFIRDEMTFFSTITEIIGIALSNAILYENLVLEHQELEQAQKRLILQERIVSLAELSSGIAHELNNPVTIILGLAELVELNAQDPREAMLKAKEHALRASRIIEGLRKMSKNRPPQLNPVDINSVLDASFYLVNHRILNEGVSLEKCLDKGIPPVMADEVQLQQIFINLINNAVDALEQSRRIVVETRHENGRAVVRIADSGKGIPPENISRVFQSFFTTKEHGSGLGLSIVKNLVEANNGTMDLASEVNRGTSITVSFPCVPS